MTTQGHPEECPYQYTNKGICGQKPADATGFCILHTQNLQKNKDEFRRAAEEKIAIGDYKFQGCVVPDGVVLDFSYSQWHGNARADFGMAQFRDGARADFSEAQFCGNAEANFEGAKFRDGAWINFFRAQFHDQACAAFGGAEFYGDAKATFFRAPFDEAAEADFAGARLQHLYFPGQMGKGNPEGFFKGRADFMGASFGQRTVFENCQFARGSTFAGVDLENLAFRGCHLAGVSFRDVWHLAEAEFENIDWNPQNTKEDHLPMRWRERFADGWEWLVGGLDRHVLQDERTAQDDEHRAEAERVYRGLKQSYERRGDYIRGGEFYYGEMEMRRLAQSTWKRRLLSVPALYWHLSGYGLKWRKAGFWFLVVWLLFAVVHGLFGFQVEQPVPESTRVLFVAPGPGAVFSWEAVGHGLWFSLGAMLLRPADIYTTTSGIGPFLVLAQGVLGPLLLGLMALAIRRKVHR